MAKNKQEKDTRNEIVELMIANAAAELAVYYYFNIVQANLTGMDGESIKGIASRARGEDRNHFEALVPRIYELGGRLPESMADFRHFAEYPPLAGETGDLAAMLDTLVEAERGVVTGYAHLCNLTADSDRRTYDLCRSILNEEIEHESWFSDFLREGGTSCRG